MNYESVMECIPRYIDLSGMTKGLLYRPAVDEKEVEMKAYYLAYVDWLESPKKDSFSNMLKKPSFLETLKKVYVYMFYAIVYQKTHEKTYKTFKDLAQMAIGVKVTDYIESSATNLLQTFSSIIQAGVDDAKDKACIISLRI